MTVPALFATTMFVSALLLFMVQPLVGKLVLPHVGGTPAVWNTCMVFFQALLLAGYYYAHKLSDISSQARQVTIHLAVQCTALVVMIIAVALTANHSSVPILTALAPEGGDFPFFSVIAMLGVAIGVPFFVVSTSAPLFSKWFSVTGDEAAIDPYFLYAASNAGSLISLLGYPIFIEPFLTLVPQTWIWTLGFFILIFMTFRCGQISLHPIPKVELKVVKPTPLDNSPPPTISDKLTWMLRAAVPSSLMLGVTTHMTTDILSVPLLWVIPLSLYLITFIIAYSNTIPNAVQQLYEVVKDVPLIRLMFNTTETGKVQAFRLLLTNITPVIVLMMIFLMISDISRVIGLRVGLDLLAFFALALLMHYELALARPSPKHLTNYFLWISFGGMCGGILNALIAPMLFPQNYEYLIAIAVGCSLLPNILSDGAKKKDTTAQILDIVFPLGLLVLFMALMCLDGTSMLLNAARVIENAMGTPVNNIAKFAIYAPPCMVCFLFVDRPRRFGLAIFMLLFVHAFAMTTGRQIVHPIQRMMGTVNDEERNKRKTETIRSFFGITNVTDEIDTGTNTYMESEASIKIGPAELEKKKITETINYAARSTSMSHGTTLHGKQFRSHFDLQWRRYDEKQSLNGVGITPTLLDDIQLMSCLSPWDATVLMGMRYANDPSKDPLTYYHRTGPVGAIFREANRRNGNAEIGMIGLGTGSVAAYAQPGQKMTFYEIDSHVRKMVDDGKHFTYVNDAKARGATIEMVMGDARLELEKETNRRYDLLLVDAFSSDSIPGHLLTVQALKLYTNRIKPGGLFAMHISNRYLKLEPVCEAIAKQNGLACRIWNDSSNDPPGKTASSWIIFAENEEVLGKAFTAPEKPSWEPLKNEKNTKAWTDDYQNFLSVISWKGLFN